MAVFSQFQTDVADLAGTSVGTNALPLLTRMAQDGLTRRYAPVFLRRSTNLPILSSSFVLPSDLLRIHKMRMWDANGVSQDMGEVPEAYGRALPTSSGNILAVYWREIGGLCQLLSVPPPSITIELDYYVKDIYLVNGTDTNLWLENAYDILLLATIAEVMLYTVDTNRQRLYAANASQALQGLQKLDVADEMSGRTMLLKGGLDA